MAKDTPQERKKGAVPLPFSGAPASNAGAIASLLAGTTGKLALASFAAAVACGGYGISLTFAALNAPAPRVEGPKLAAPADPNLRQITPQTSMEVVGIAADRSAGQAAATTDAQAALAAAAAQGEVPAVASAPDPGAVAAAAAAALQGAAPAGGRPGRIIARKSAFKNPNSDPMAGTPQPGADVTPFSAARPGGATATTLPASVGAAAAPPAGKSRAMDREAAQRIAAGIGRASAAGGRAGAMRQLGDANTLSRGGGGAEATATRGAQAFDGGAPTIQAAPGALGPTEAAQEAAAATADDYGEGSAPINSQPQGGGGAVSPAPEAEHKNATPWQPWVQSATYLLLAATALVFSVGLIAGAAKGAAFAHNYPLAIKLWTWAKWLSGVATAMGLAVVAIGGKIMSQGQTSQGLIFTLGGTLITGLAILELVTALKADPMVDGLVTTQSHTLDASLSAGAGPEA